MSLIYCDYWDIHHRKSTRLKNRDYAAGMYFVTICTAGRDYLFGDVVDGEMVLNKFGAIVDRCWKALPNHFSFMSIDEFAVMPNHVHGIVILTPRCRGTADECRDNADKCRGKACLAPTPRRCVTMEFQKPPPQSLCSVVGSFKSAVTRQANILRNARGECIWQRNYHEHVIRYHELNRIRQYIRDNPKNWHHDKHHWR